MIDHLDHLVLTTAQEEACIRFYVDVMGMSLESFGAGRKAFAEGRVRQGIERILEVEACHIGQHARRLQRRMARFVQPVQTAR